MTTNYFDCKIIETTNALEAVLGKLYKTIHEIFAAQKITHVGISFPDLDQKPGKTIRLFSDKKTLSDIKDNRKLDFFLKAGAITMSDIKPVPEKHKLAVFQRDRFSEKATELYSLKSELRLVKHLAKKGIELDEKKLAGRHKLISARQKKSLPFILMQSKSTRQAFSLFIKKDANPQKFQIVGSFNFYGLSTRANPVALPIF
ncbi:MAG: type I-F CRISPR-associated endoribonuclease Cas6/Csy4 [Desulfobacteraceae bacterium]|nr:type I-F CRISPR-associated endoribonuclease Cas6/Csy4 [Desulfobacteraceae bacterium]